jgi:hypothetical protein
MISEEEKNLLSIRTTFKEDEINVISDDNVFSEFRSSD